MSGQVDPYIRVYYSIINDGKFEEIYADDAALAAWLRLLLVADALYPASAPIPMRTRKRALAALVDCGLVELVGFGQFRIVGLAAERARRSAPGHKGADGRWHRNADALPPDSESNAPLNMPAMPDTPRRAEPRRAEPDSPKPPQVGAVQKKGRQSGTNPRANGDAPRQREEQVKAGLLAAFKAIGGAKSMPKGLKDEDDGPPEPDAMVDDYIGGAR